MRRLSVILASAVLASASPVFAQHEDSGTPPLPFEKVVDQAMQLVAQHRSAEALALLSPALEDFDQKIADASRNGVAFCATTPQQIVLYSMMAANQKKSGTVFGATMCNGIFIKAYALGELKRPQEAVATLERLTVLSPMDAHYFVELGFAYRTSGATDKAMDAYRKALEISAGDKDDGKHFHAAALRGIGYLLIDKNDLDGAADAYRKSLIDEPDNAISKSELDYINKMRKRSD